MKRTGRTYRRPLFAGDDKFQTKMPTTQKQNGAYYTPESVVQTLLNWVIRREDDRLLDPSCGDGRFIARHPNSVGIEWDSASVEAATCRAPSAVIHDADFFAWAAETSDRFDCVAGNPPFIRYQNFKGNTRSRALSLCRDLGASFTGLTSSWAPFIVTSASLVARGGRMAFVVPAEIGHAPYGAPVIKYLVERFSVVHIVAMRSKLFPTLSEDCWLLYADGCGGQSADIRFTTLDEFRLMQTPPREYEAVSVRDWRTSWGCRLRPFIMSQAARDLYREVAADRDSTRLGDLGRIGIGYVTGANDFFHLRPSEAERSGIPDSLLRPTVRNGRALRSRRVDAAMVEQWRRADAPMWLLHLSRDMKLPDAIRRYLDSSAGKAARQSYKCRTRDPWYVVPSVRIPDFFLSYMSGVQPSMVRNDARCTCTNSVHGIQLKSIVAGHQLEMRWNSLFVQLSCELEGHPLGGGMLKLEPREAAQVILPDPSRLARLDEPTVDDALATMRSWRHYSRGR